MTKFKSLVNEADRFNIAQMIRNYANAVEFNKPEDAETIQWIKWANKKADWYDPRINRMDEILGKL